MNDLLLRDHILRRSSFVELAVGHWAGGKYGVIHTLVGFDDRAEDTILFLLPIKTGIEETIVTQVPSSIHLDPPDINNSLFSHNPLFWLDMLWCYQAVETNDESTARVDEWNVAGTVTETSVKADWGLEAIGGSGSLGRESE